MMNKRFANEKPVVIFGGGRFASLAAYCLQQDSGHQVAGFAVDRNFMPPATDQHDGLPLVAFDELPSRFPPHQYCILVHVGYLQINGLRKQRYEQVRAWGYECINYVSSRAVTWPNLQLGDNCTIYEQTVIQPFSSLGRNVIVRSACHISHHCHIEDHCFIAAGVVMGGGVTVGEQSFIGVGAVIRDNIRIAPRTFVGAGAVIVQDTQPDGVYVGNPAKLSAKTSLEVTST